MAGWVPWPSQDTFSHVTKSRQAQLHSLGFSKPSSAARSERFRPSSLKPTAGPACLQAAPAAWSHGAEQSQLSAGTQGLLRAFCVLHHGHRPRMGNAPWLLLLWGWVSCDKEL